MDFSVLLPEASDDLKPKLQRLIQQSLQMPVLEKKNLPIWPASFYKVESSPFWLGLSDGQKFEFLTASAAAILKEAISIEHAGIAYANKMALLAESQEERHYYTTVANEELHHLLYLQPYFSLQIPNDVPPFSQMIVDLIAQESKRDLIILVQVLLEGWGINHYQSLLNGIENVELKGIFSQIVFDETRHHGGGIILTQSAEVELSPNLIGKIQNIIDAVRIGPLQTAQLLTELNGLKTESEIEQLLQSIHALESTTIKLKIVQQNLAKVLSSQQMQSLIFTPFSLIEMSLMISKTASDRLTLPSSRNLEYTSPPTKLVL